MSGGLFDSMSAQVSQECEAEIARAREEAEAIIAAARDRCAVKREEILRHVRGEIAIEDRRAHLMAQAEADREVMSLHKSVKDDVLANAAAELQRIAESTEFGDIVEKLLAEAVTATDGAFVVLAPLSQVSRCESWLKANGHSGVTVHAEAGLTDGIAVQDPAQTYRITNTLSSRLRLLDSEARKHCMSRLFGRDA
jgi:vacuolar-type H+-ATPase subunit E/Vma4